MKHLILLCSLFFTSTFVFSAQLIGVGERGTIVQSHDVGKTWTSARTVLNDIACHDKICVAVGNAGQIWRKTSTDWQLEDSNVVSNINAVAASNHWFVAVGNGGTLLLSQDGKAWQRSNVLMTTENLNTVATNDVGQWLIAGAHGLLLRGETVNSELQWTAIKNPDPEAIDDNFVQARYFPIAKSWYVLSSAGTLLVSINDTKWAYNTNLTNYSATFIDMAMNTINDRERLVVLARPLKLEMINTRLIFIRDINGPTWQSHQINIPLNGLISDKKGFSAFANSFLLGSVIYHSTDAQAWQGGEVLRPLLYNMRAVPADGQQNGSLYAVGYDASILHSSQGEHWAIENGGVTTMWMGIAYSGRKWFAAGMGHDALASSKDGDTWKNMMLPTADSHAQAPVNMQTRLWFSHVLNQVIPRRYHLQEGEDILNTWLTGISCAKHTCVAIGVNPNNATSIIYRYNSYSVIPHWRIVKKVFGTLLFGIAHHRHSWLIGASSVNLSDETVANVFVSHSNGLFWSEKSDPQQVLPQQVMAVAMNDQQWLAVTESGGIMSSRCGRYWQVQSSLDPNTELNSVAVDNNHHWLVVGSNSQDIPTLYHGNYSTTSSTWHWQPERFIPLSDSNDSLQTVAWFQNVGWLLTTNAGKIFQSSDSYHWVPVTLHNEQTLMAVATSGTSSIA